MTSSSIKRATQTELYAKSLSYEKEELVRKRSNQGEKQRLRDAEKESQQEGGKQKTELVLEKELMT